MKLLIHSQTSAVAPLKFGNGYVISFQTLLVITYPFWDWSSSMLVNGAATKTLIIQNIQIIKSYLIRSGQFQVRINLIWHLLIFTDGKVDLSLWALSQYKDCLSRYGDFHYKDRTVETRSHHSNGNFSYTSKTASIKYSDWLRLNIMTVFPNYRILMLKIRRSLYCPVQHNKYHSIVDDALARYVARPSAAMILTMYNRQFFVLHKEGFLLPVSCQCEGTTYDVNTCL